MKKVRCKPCVGSGLVMGGGMMIKDCDECHGTGKISMVEEDHVIDYLQFKTSESYEQAIDRILKSTGAVVTREAAEQMFDAEFNRQNEPLPEEPAIKVSRKRPRKYELAKDDDKDKNITHNKELDEV